MTNSRLPLRTSWLVIFFASTAGHGKVFFYCLVDKTSLKGRASFACLVLVGDFLVSSPGLKLMCVRVAAVK